MHILFCLKTKIFLQNFEVKTFSKKKYLKNTIMIGDKNDRRFKDEKNEKRWEKKLWELHVKTNCFVE